MYERETWRTSLRELIIVTKTTLHDCQPFTDSNSKNLPAPRFELGTLSSTRRGAVRVRNNNRYTIRASTTDVQLGITVINDKPIA